MTYNGYRFQVRRGGDLFVYPEHGDPLVASGYVTEGGRGWSWRLNWPTIKTSGSEYMGKSSRKEALIDLAIRLGVPR